MRFGHRIATAGLMLLSSASIATLATSGAQVPDASARVGPAGLGMIRGRVVVADAPAPKGRPAVAELGDHHRRDAVDRRRAVVYLDTAPRHAFDELPAREARMDQRGEQFVPRVLAITVGTTVQFPNNDTTFHNVFSLSRTRTFDLGRYPPRRIGAVKFDRPGIVPVFCDIHSHMSAYILVFSHPFFAVTDADGRYAIANVPSGAYTLKIWSELGQADPRRITVVDREATEADFHVGRGHP